MSAINLRRIYRLGIFKIYTTIKIIDITFNSKNELDTITFEWHPLDGELDRVYTYKTNIGLVETRRP